MSRRARIEQMVEELAEPIARAEGQILVAVQYTVESGRPRMLVTLDKPGGVSIGDCQRFSDLLGARLDLEEDRLPDGYYLEVSSPGLDRVLKKDREFEVFRGRQVQIRTYAPVEGRKEFFGTLEGLCEGRVVITDEQGKMLRIPRNMVARAKLHYRSES